MIFYCSSSKYWWWFTWLGYINLFIQYISMEIKYIASLTTGFTKYTIPLSNLLVVVDLKECVLLIKICTDFQLSYRIELQHVIGIKQYNWNLYNKKEKPSNYQIYWYHSKLWGRSIIFLFDMVCFWEISFFSPLPPYLLSCYHIAIT